MKANTSDLFPVITIPPKPAKRQRARQLGLIPTQRDLVNTKATAWWFANEHGSLGMQEARFMFQARALVRRWWTIYGNQGPEPELILTSP